MGDVAFTDSEFTFK